MKKILLTLTIVAAGLGFGGCADDGRIKVDIVQFVTHNALDLANEGFQQALAAEGFGADKVKITVRNPQTDSVTLSTMARKSVRNADLILAIATPAALSVKAELENANKTTPLLFTAVTDPIDAGLLVNPEAPEGHITGTNDMNPVAAQIELFRELNPNINKIGMLYTTSEPNSLVQINLAKQKCDDLGLAYAVKGITNATEIAAAITALKNSNIQGLYIPTDNVIASAMPIVRESCKDGLPVVAAEASMVVNGALMSYGVDYLELGKLTGKMAAEILGGTPISQVPSVGLSEFELIINAVVAEEAGIVIPAALLDKADIIIDEE